jgi:rhodanese-related sulfurtransferase
MKRMVYYGGLLSTLALLLVACGAGTAAPGDDAAGTADLAKNADGYTDISVEQLSSMMEDKGFTLVNVHLPYEGELPETDLFIPYDQITDHLDQIPDKDAPIVLYCRSGSMSTSAAKDLADQGYTNVFELDGGFNDWKASGYEFLDTR